MVKASVVRYTKLAGIVGIICIVFLILRTTFYLAPTYSTNNIFFNQNDRWFNDPAALVSIINKVNHTETTGREFCGGKLKIYSSQFARITDVAIDPNLALSRPGGEEISKVIQQSENIEYMKFKYGYFQLKCPRPFDYIPNNLFNLGHRNHLNSYLASLQFVDEIILNKGIKRVTSNTTVFAVTRYEYVNFYHTMTDFYNVFLNCRFFGIDQDKVHILFLDSHPKGSLDSVWTNLFNGFSRAGQLDSQIQFSELVWVTMGYLSPLMNHRANELPLLHEFRQFFLSRFSIPPKLMNRMPSCSGGMSVLFVWRRNYVAHPRNPSGKVVRKIQNEDELVNHLRQLFPKSLLRSIEGVQLDILPMEEQLKYITKTDIIIGMHGAGLTHALFLSPKSALIELYPRYWSSSNKHFRKIAEWRSLFYERWVNKDMRNEKSGYYTYVPPSVISTLVRKVLHKMHCLLPAP